MSRRSGAPMQLNEIVSPFGEEVRRQFRSEVICYIRFTALFIVRLNHDAILLEEHSVAVLIKVFSLRKRLRKVRAALRMWLNYYNQLRAYNLVVSLILRLPPRARSPGSIYTIHYILSSSRRNWMDYAQKDETKDRKTMLSTLSTTRSDF
ncbi:unnamed protein product [Caenorhabditis auriculariae]|uniref:Uncharacterized protein n=1 Tax=Caenorhabditis auriculariae TaxID=2777116 RepID=A0A8S1H1N8_9PELO|nr:unnamed protein product [Caenorhabditis auriculariae]